MPLLSPVEHRTVCPVCTPHITLLRSERVAGSNSFMGGGALPHINKQSLDTISPETESEPFKAQPHKTPSISDASHKPRLLPAVLMDQLQTGNSIKPLPGVD